MHTNIKEAEEEAITMSQMYKHVWVVESGTYTTGSGKTGCLYVCARSDYLDDVSPHALLVFQRE